MGVPQNYQEAIRWYQKAAAQGDIESQKSMTVANRMGWGVEKNYKKAAEWYRKAAALGDGDAALFLAVVYYYGEGVKKDIVEAYTWGCIAAIKHAQDAETFTDGLREKMTDEQMTESSDLLVKFFKQYPKMLVAGIKR
jgi:hypothetical protein